MLTKQHSIPLHRYIYYKIKHTNKYDFFSDIMGGCFLCDVKLYGERTRVCSSVTPHSNVPYPEKIAELMGEEFVIIVTPADHMCKKCTSLLTHMDKLENDLKLVKNAMLSYIQKKYGILPADQPVKTLDVSVFILLTDLHISCQRFIYYLDY